MGSYWREALVLRRRLRGRLRGPASPSSLSAPYLLPSHLLPAGRLRGRSCRQPPVPLPPAATADARASGCGRSHKARRVPHFTLTQPGPPPPAGTGGVLKGAVWTSSPSNRLARSGSPCGKTTSPRIHSAPCATKGGVSRAPPPRNAHRDL